jgi:class 3 adenylate cyclase
MPSLILCGAPLAALDVVLVWRYDRFARSRRLVNALQNSTLGRRFYFLSDTSTPPRRRELIFTVMASLAQFESALMSERVKAGMARVRRKETDIARPDCPTRSRRVLPGSMRRGPPSVHQQTVRHWLWDRVELCPTPESTRGRHETPEGARAAGIAMNFYSVVDQAIALLRQRGRVTYRALKRQFALDDEALADLTEELIYGQRLAADEDGRVLVWTGDRPMVTEPHASQSPSGHPSPTHEAPSAQAATPPVSPMADAERRQLTVMFCDLVDSTALSGQLDPEDLRDVVRAYHQVCAEVITRFDGHIAQLLGDGLLVYFGYPQAHEDDPHRAIRTGLGLLDAMGDLNAHLRRENDMALALRIGIHTGLVVVGAMGGQGRQEQLALGETPNIAARMQGLAASNTLVISEKTYRLVQGYFDCEALGAQTLRGVTEPIVVSRVLSERGAQGRLDIVQARGLTPLVGRESEVTLLLDRWEQAKAGQGHVVLLTGEAGIGKSRLVQVLKDHVATEPHIRWECWSAEYSQNGALFPLVDLFQRLLRFEASETPDAKGETHTRAEPSPPLRHLCHSWPQTWHRLLNIGILRSASPGGNAGRRWKRLSPSCSNLPSVSRRSSWKTPLDRSVDPGIPDLVIDQTPRRPCCV